jgi:hypothetical protein
LLGNTKFPAGKVPDVICEALWLTAAEAAGTERTKENKKIANINDVKIILVAFMLTLFFLDKTFLKVLRNFSFLALLETLFP